MTRKQGKTPAGQRPRTTSRPEMHRGGRDRRSVAGKVYSFTEQHFLLLAELHRLCPDRPPPLDFDRLTPGAESIETASLLLYEDLRRSFDESLFLVFCKLNAERLQDYIDTKLDVEAWPLETDEIIAEAYARLFHELLRPAERRQGLASTVFDLLADRADQIIAERVRYLRSITLPLPGLPAMPFVAGEGTIRRTGDSLAERGFELPENQLVQWLAFALLRIDEESRRILHLHERRGLPVKQVAEILQVPTLAAARKIKDAQLQLHEEISRLLDLFAGTGTSSHAEIEADTDDDEHEEDGDHDDAG